MLSHISKKKIADLEEAKKLKKKFMKRCPQKSLQRQQKPSPSLDKQIPEAQKIVGCFLFAENTFICICSIPQFPETLKAERNLSIINFVNEFRETNASFKYIETSGNPYTLKRSVNDEIDIIVLISGHLPGEEEGSAEHPVHLLQACLECFLDKDQFWKSLVHGSILPFELFGKYELFRSLNLSSNGYLSQDEFENAAPRLGVCVKNPFAALDESRKGHINYFEFCDFLLQSNLPPKASSIQDELARKTLTPEIPILENVGANRHLNAIYCCTNLFELLVKQLIACSTDATYEMWLKKIEDHLWSLGQFQTLVITLLGAKNEDYQSKIRKLEKERDPASRNLLQQRKKIKRTPTSEQMEANCPEYAKSLETNETIEIETNGELVDVDFLELTESLEIAKKKQEELMLENRKLKQQLNKKVNIDGLIKELAHLKKENAKLLQAKEKSKNRKNELKLLQENKQLKARLSDIIDSTGGLENISRLRSLDAENRRLREELKTSSWRGFDGENPQTVMDQLRLERDRYKFQVQALRDTGKIYRLSIEELKEHVYRVEEKLKDYKVQLQETEEKLITHSTSFVDLKKRLGKTKNQELQIMEEALRNRTKAAAVFESQLEAERRENLELQEEIYYLRRSLIQIDSRVEHAGNSGDEEQEKHEKSRSKANSEELNESRESRVK